jgi:hypothetical protein
MEACNGVSSAGGSNVEPVHLAGQAVRPLCAHHPRLRRRAARRAALALNYATAGPGAPVPKAGSGDDLTDAQWEAAWRAFWADETETEGQPA